MTSTGQLSAALRRVKEGNWPRPNSRMKAMRALSPQEKAKYSRLYAIVVDTEHLMDTILDESLYQKYDGLSTQDWNNIELESKRRRGLPLKLGGKRVFQSRYTHAKIDMRTLLGLVPPKAVRNKTTSKARSEAAKETGARKSKAIKEEKEAAAAIKAESYFDEDASDIRIKEE